MILRPSLLLLLASGSSCKVDALHWVDVPGAIITSTRRFLNLSGISGYAHSSKESPYDRVMGHPVFQVTTPWGSAYMNMEKLDLDDIMKSDEVDLDDVASGKATLASDSNQYRTISLYYMDPDDALSAHAEFLQMEQMSKADIRVTTVSLAKALRSAANLGNGLLTGQPIDYKTGKVLSTREGGSLRHKIMPPKKQLFYAARCYGKERVGLFGTSGSSQDSSARELAVTAVLGNSALSLRNLQRRQAKRDRKIKTAPKTTWEAQYGHMDGQLGIPVFYARGMERQHPLWKGLVSGHRRETPLFFNYEDLERAWKKTRSKDKPEEPTVEVFNLWDVLTSMDKEQDRQRIQSARLPITKRALQAVTKPLQRRLSALPTSNNKHPLDLDSITFVPSSDACLYKESITARGNGKARLRPMR
ncbi:Tic22-like family protein [Nitzschia inconspicua]|uniref:Tic22-like family protein n=1 Tax=Nitzschia inconspicua TaxID=303405 RepID=A0A9K3LXD7_9STRA|nr:Tic22-like family protein [Nitzschia inconspicua]